MTRYPTIFATSTDKVLAICSAEIFSHALLQHPSPGLCNDVERPRGDVVAVCKEKGTVTSASVHNKMLM